MGREKRNNLITIRLKLKYSTAGFEQTFEKKFMNDMLFISIILKIKFFLFLSISY